MKKKRIVAFLAAALVLCLLSACGQSPTAPAAESAPPAEASSQVAGAADMTEVVDVLEPSMQPVYAECLQDGIYPVEMKSSSSMFKAESCELLVSDGRMEAILHMSSDSYSYMYAGTAEQAAAADEADRIPLEADPDGGHSFTLPIEALDAGVSCASFSARKELWYDRTLLFRSDSLPLEAFSSDALTWPEDLNLSDGSYTVEVTLAGGSGKSSIGSPALLTVRDGVVTARIVWSSSHYDYMKVADETYLPISGEEHSTFEIPVLVFDHGMPVVADTTAMSQPYEIAYTLLFDSSSLQSAA